MKKLRFFDSLKFVLATVACTFILNVAHAATTTINSVIAYGKTEQNGTPTPTNPVPIMTNNGVLKASANLLNPATVPDENKYVAKDGSVLAPSNGTFRHSDFIPVQGGETYYFGITPFAASVAGLAWYSNETTSGRIGGMSGTELGQANMLATAPAGAKYMRFSWRIDNGYDTNWRNSVYVCKQGAMSSFHAFGEMYADDMVETILDSAGHTATTQMLLGINDTYRDEQNITTGAITRKVGVKVLDGSESWYLVNLTQHNVYDVMAIALSSVAPDAKNNLSTVEQLAVKCTHLVPRGVTAFNGDVSGFVWATKWFDSTPRVAIRVAGITTVAQFKQWLAEQYAAGTPVIVVYPLETETTENVATQQMTTAPVRQTAGSILGMPIEVVLGDGTREWVRDMITIATTRYSEEQFAPVETRLDAAVAAVDTVVTQTMTQAQAIDTIATSKQTRPDEGCDAKYCLLVEDEDGTPHWYPIAGANGVAHALPAGYTELQYLQTDGNSWIDTGIKGDMSYKYEIDFQQLDAGQYRNWGAFDQSGWNGGPNMSFTYSSGFAVRWTVSGNSNQLVDNLSSLDSNRHHIIIDNGYITWDGVNKGRSTGHQDNYVFRYNLFLGTVNPGGKTPTSNAKSKYYLYKVWNTSGELIQDLIPAKNSSGVVGMYDMVSGQFFTNAGTGTFVAGPDM